MPAAWRAAVAAQTAAGAQAPASFGAVVACARFHGPRAALVGDAAHAVTSTLGQARPWRAAPRCPRARGDRPRGRCGGRRVHVVVEGVA
jgi:hypothetical protein